MTHYWVTNRFKGDSLAPGTAMCQKVHSMMCIYAWITFSTRSTRFDKNVIFMWWCRRVYFAIFPAIWQWWTFNKSVIMGPQGRHFPYKVPDHNRQAKAIQIECSCWHYSKYFRLWRIKQIQSPFAIKTDRKSLGPEINVSLLVFCQSVM